jgi:hypothetical protein
VAGKVVRERWSAEEQVYMADRLGPRRGSLPTPDRQHLGLITHDAKDPDTTAKVRAAL